MTRKCKLVSQRQPFPPQQISCVISAYRGRAAAYRSKLTGDALAESKLSLDQLVQIQQALITRGFLNAAEADGEFGPTTRTAIKKYHEDNGFPQSDYLSTTQRQALLEKGEALLERGTVGVAGNQSHIAYENRHPTKDVSIANQRRAGEFTRLVNFPATCQKARELGESQLWVQLPFSPTRQPGPTCREAKSCLEMMRSQIVNAIQYFRANPSVFDAFRNQVTADSPINGNYFVFHIMPRLASVEMGVRLSRNLQMRRSLAYAQ